MYFKRRSIKLFKLFAFIDGLALTIICTIAIISGNKETESIIVCALLGILGIAMMIAAIVTHFHFGNMNAGKSDKTANINYTMTFRGDTRPLSSISALSEALLMLQPGEEIDITLQPEFFGLVSWKFTKIKKQFLSFVVIRKKETLRQYFIMPCRNTDQALAPFTEVFSERKAINTSRLISMKKYNAVLDVYKLK